VHYVAMMVIVAGISLYGTSGTDDFKRSYDAALSGEIGDAISYATAGIRRSLREADTGRENRHGGMKQDVRYDVTTRF
jgi:hypothetical protein